MNIVAIKPTTGTAKPHIKLNTGLWWAVEPHPRVGPYCRDDHMDAAQEFVCRLNMPLLKPDLGREQAL